MSLVSERGAGKVNATQLQVALRCRGSSTCNPALYLITQSGAQKAVVIPTPAGGGWYYLLLDETAAGWPKMPNTDQYSVWLDVGSQTMDVDTLWIGSDINAG